MNKTMNTTAVTVDDLSYHPYIYGYVSIFVGALSIFSNYMIVHVTFFDNMILRSKSNFLIGYFAFTKLGNAIGNCFVSCIFLYFLVYFFQEIFSECLISVNWYQKYYNDQLLFIELSD